MKSKQQRITSILLCMVLFFLCGGCTGDARFGMQELSKRLAEQDERYGFSLEGISFSNDFYHIPFSFASEQDVLLSCKEDPDGRLLQILLTTDKERAPQEDFLNLTKTLIAVFFGVDEFEATAIAQEAGLTDTAVLFSDHTSTATKGRYSFTFFSTPLSVTAILKYDDAVVVTETEQ